MKFKLGHSKTDVSKMGRSSILQYVSNNKNIDKTQELDILYNIVSKNFTKGDTLGNILVVNVEAISQHYIINTVKPLFLMLDEYNELTEETIKKHKEYLKFMLNSDIDYINTFNYSFDVKNKEFIENLCVYDLIAIILEVYGIEYSIKLLSVLSEAVYELTW